jgi:zinc protease
MLRRVGVLAVAVVLAGCAHAPAPTPAAPPPTLAASASNEPTREVLPNGVVLITREHRASDVVSVQLWMRVGGRDETPEELGLSHYLEHMLFKGTPTRPPGSIDRLIEGLGGTSNAFTAYDFTHFDVLLPAEALRTGVEILADIAVNASFVPQELESEKKVVFEEMNLVQDDPDKSLSRRLDEEAYMPYPYGRPLLGTRELVQSLTRERLAAYYHKHYIPANMVVVVVGAVRPADARAAVTETFGRLTGPPATRAELPALPVLDRGRREDVTRAEEQAYLGMAWLAAPTGDPDIFAVDLLSYILGDGPSSRLNQTLREQRGLVSAVDATYVPRQKSGLVTVTARMDPGKLADAERGVLDVVRRVRDEGVTDGERQRAIVTAESSYAFDIETAEGLARSYGQAETTWTLADELRYLARLREVAAAQIQAAARKYLGDEDYARVRFRAAGGDR